jgi:hypothetical protein
VSIRRIRLTNRLLGATVPIDVATVPDAGPIWIQIATAGTYKGYAGGTRTVVFDKKLFDSVVKNFRAHPWYQPGADGIGMKRVVPFDYEHASEMDPTSGTIPQSGAPAPAWALELDVRTGADGAVQLWSLTDPVTDEVRGQLKTGGYLSTSVALSLDAIDHVTAEEIGAVLTSVAFTNHPFVQGMSQIAARVEVWGEAESPEEMIVGLRDILELEETAPAELVSAAIQELGAAFIEGRTYPGYPDGVGCLLDQVRRLIGLRKLASAQEIIAAAGQALTVMPASKPPTQPAPPAPGDQMDLNAFSAKLAVLLRVRNHEDAILAAAEEGATSTNALEQLQALLGSNDVQDTLGKAKELVDMADQYRDTVAALSAANDALAGYKKKDAEAEVEQVAASMGLNADQAKRLKPVLLKQRLEAGKDDKTLAAWRAENPITPAVQRARQSVLTKPVLAGPGNTQFATTATEGDEEGSKPHPLEGFPGRNKVEKCAAYLTAKEPGFKELSRGDQIFRAGEYLKAPTPL